MDKQNKMKNKHNINSIADLAKLCIAAKRLNETLSALRLEVVALLHNKESLERENKYLRELLENE
ncbi:MAG: hypothetical protein KAS32_04845 [Candidatus Peribacteraceae bacterium]|nr:hypothetical protein [Candidatus Peribacteraceae bacterium]